MVPQKSTNLLKSKNKIMEKNISRRNALTTALVASSGFLWSSSAGRSSFSPKRIFSFEGLYGSLVKHGQPKNENFMVWSLLTCENPKGISEIISSIRDKNKYRTRLSYTSNDKYKTGIASSVFEWVANEKGLQFSIFRFGEYQSLTDKITDKELQERTLNAMRSFDIKGLTSINTKLENGYGPSEEFNNSLQSTTGFEMTPERVSSDDLIQINDLISGTLFSLMNPKGQPKSKLKLELNRKFLETFRLKENEIRDGQIGSNINLKTLKL